MATPWIDNVKNAKQLSVFAGSSIMGGIWRAPFLAALQEFNRLSGSLNLGVTLVASSTPPEGNGLGGADVQFEAVNGAFSFTLNGFPLSGNVPRTSVSGLTKHMNVIFSQGTGNAATKVTRIEKALIAVPATPLASNARRIVGDGVKRCIAVHELIHACGLNNADHAQNDVFFGFPQLLEGATAKDDQMGSGTVRLPPIVIGSGTAAAIRSNWA